MAKSRKNTLPVLLDIKFDGSLNKFEETYGDHITYAEIEQESYIDLKNMVFEKINPKIKFRKFNREKNVLTLKVDMLDDEYQLLQDILNKKIVNEKATNDIYLNPEGKIIMDRFNFLHPFIISNHKIMTKEDLLKVKKVITQEDEIEMDRAIEVSLDELDENYSEDDFN